MHNYSFYVFGGSDIKEGSFNDLWRLKLNFIEEKTTFRHENEVNDVKWEQVRTTGHGPKPISHHSGILQEGHDMFIVYGGI